MPAGGSALDTVDYDGRALPILSLERGLRLPASTAPVSTRRALVFRVQDVWIAAVVDAVLEVVTIDAATVNAIDAGATTLIGARGRFVRRGHDVIILDMLRVVRAVYEATQHPAAERA